MKRFWKILATGIFLALPLALLAAAPALAQSVQQSGTVTRNHVPVWNTSGVISDGGSSADSPISSIGVTNNGGAGFCVSSDRQTAAGRNQLCFGASTAGAATISLQNYGTAAAQNLNFVINGSTVTIPTGGGTFLFGNSPFTAGNVPCFFNSSGVIQDCGLALSSGTVTSGVWQGTAVAIGFGGTGSNTASGARTALGLGSMALQGSGAVAITGGTITGMPSPSNGSDVAIKSYVDSTSTGLNLLAQSRLATAAILPNTPTYSNGASGVGATLTAASNTTLTVDGTSTALNDVILVKNQAAPAQNGIYTQTQVGTGSVPWILTRATYFDQTAEMKAGSYTFITAGSTNVNTSWTMQAAVTTVGTDPANFSLFSSSTGGVSSIASNTGAFTLTQPVTNNINAIILNASITPQVRITLVSGLAAPTTDQVGIGTIWVTPTGGNLVPIYDGTNMIPTAFSEVSQAASDTTKSPAAVANNSVYDIFCWIDSGVNRCTRGPAWTNDTTRGTGTALTLVNGIWLNNASITNGPVASRGTYVGTVRSNGTATFDLKFGTSAAGGGQAWFGVWNAYNRVLGSPRVNDSNAAWTVSTPGPAAMDAAGTNAGLGNRISIVHGIDEDAVAAQVTLRGISTASQSAQFGYCLDSTSAFAGNSWQSWSFGAADINHIGGFNGYIGLGFHFLQACEAASAGSQTGRQTPSTGAAGGATTATVWW